MAFTEINPEQIDSYLEQHQKKELLRFVTVGSVDDGKSTLIGRLLHDTKGVYEDQLSAVKKASSQGEMEIDFSLFTDGLKAEREQGITIDVAYRYFSTANRKFIIADTPGHVQYTRNMATGASTANVGVILIDARLGVIQQSRRHAYIASLLGIPHLLVAVNKMDLRDYDQQVFDDITADFTRFAEGLTFKNVKFVPISAKLGDNVVHKSQRTPWYDGGTFLEYLETVPIASDRNFEDFRFPVQHVIRPNLDYRGFAGEVASGVVGKGDTLMVMPSRKQSKVAAIDTFDGEIESAHASQAVTIRLEDEIDVSRGDMLVPPDNAPVSSRRLSADVVWLSEKDLDCNKSYLLKCTTQMVRASVESVESVVDLESLQKQRAQTLSLNDIGQLRLVCHRPIAFDPYQRNRSTGAFILIDSISNNTVAAGMIAEASEPAGPASTSERPPDGGQVSPQERRERLAQVGSCLIVTGDDAGPAAFAIERALYDAGRVAAVIGDRDEVSQTLGAPADSGIQQSIARLAQIGATVIAALDVEPSVRDGLVRSLPERVFSLEIDDECRFAGEPLTLSGNTVAAGDLEKLGRAVVATLSDKGLLLEAD